MTARSLHPVPRRSANRRDAWRRHLLVGCATASTLALAAHGDKASAQAFQLNDANPTVQAGSVDFSSSTPGVETITLNSDSAIISWNRAETDFLPAGNVATFQNGVGVTNFTVLNRISSLDGGPVRFDGTVLSRVNGNPGGTVIFQNTGGIIVGSTAVFDIGNLVLTSLNVFETGYGDFVNDGGGLDMGSLSQSGIVIEPDAQIRATAEGSYVVLAGSFVDHGGRTSVNGTAAYIGAQDVSYTINEGLFDIVVNIGSFSETPIIHTGTTGGPASTGAGDPHRIIMLAAPTDEFFSSAATMLISGSVGFDEAVSASIENGQIVLSAGFNIENGQLGSEAKYAEANIAITGGTFTSDVFARATRNVIATSEDGPLSFSGDFTAEAFERARLGAVNGAVTVGGDVSLTAYGALEFENGYGVSSGFGQDGFAPLGIDRTGGTAEITAANGEAVTVAGDATLNAPGVGEFENDDDFEAGDGFGGVVRVATTTGGSVAIGGDLTMLATGTGAATDYVPDLGGNGFGGNAIVSVQSGGITVDGGLFVNVSGSGSRTNGLETGVGSTGQGGFVNIFAVNGDIQIAGSGQILALGTGGGIEQPDGSATGGTGRGGSVSVFGGSGSVTLGAAMTVDISGQGGAGGEGGLGRGGDISVEASNGTVDVGNLTVLANGTGGVGGLDGNSGNGGDGEGGFVFVTAFGSGGPSLIQGGVLNISSYGIGGGTDAAGVNGGDGLGGTIQLVAQDGGGALEFGNVTAESSGFGGAGIVNGGAGIGGEVFAGIEETGYGASGTPASVTLGNTFLRADGAGGNGSVGGAGTGGTVELASTASGNVELAALNMLAEAQGGSGVGSDGGDATGGNANIIARNAGSISVANNLSNTPLISVSATGGQNNGGGDLVGGAGTGGTLTVRAESGGTIDLPQNPGPLGFIRVWARGTGGAAQAPGGRGGVGTGGTINMGADNGELTGALLSLSAFGQGGSSVNSQVNVDGGDGFGGQRLLYANNGGRLAITTAGGVAGGSGGNASGSGVGGDGSLGVARLDVDGGTVELLGPLEIVSQATGGNGATGGDGTGGDAVLRVVNGGTIVSTSSTATLLVSSTGFGGLASINSGGNGQGGVARVETDGTGSSVTATQGIFVAAGIGGSAAGSGTAGTGTGGRVEFGTGPAGNDWTFGNLVTDAIGLGANGAVGGAGTGGVVNLGVLGGTLDVTGTLSLDASGTGGSGTTGAGGVGTGGAATVYVNNDGELSFASAIVVSDGLGGAGATGGNGTGGIQVNSPFEEPSGGAFISSFGGTVTGTSATVRSRGIGGSGSSGAGGNGQGGSVAIAAFNSPTPALIELGSANLDNSAIGGAGGTTAGGSGAAGGNAAAGNLIVAEANSLNGTLRIGTLSFTSTAFGGAGGAGTTGVGGRGGDAFGGFVQAGGTSGEGSGDTNGVVEFGTVTADASAVGGAGGANGGAGGDGQGGSAALLSRGGTLAVTSVGFVANGTGGASATGAGGNGSGGRVIALLTTRFQTTLGSTNTIGAFSGIAGGTGGTGATTGQGRHGTGFVDVIGSTATFGTASLTTFGPGTPSIPELAAPVYVRAQGGSLTFTTSLDVDSVAAVNIQPEGGTIALQGNANIVSQTGIAINATDAGVMSGGAWNLDTAGAVVISHSNRPGSGATVSVAQLTAFGSDFTASSGTLVRASQAIGVNVANLATIAGTVVSPSIFIASRDIDIPASGFLGDAGTTAITLNVNPQSAQTVIGGTATGAGYTLTQAEANRIRTASLQIDATPTSSAPSRPADLVLRDLTLSATPNPAGAAVNRLQISLNAGEGAGGIVQVEGAVRVENATSSSGIDIIAGERIQIINPAGSLRVLASGGLPSGSIGMQSANIWSASQAIIDQLIASPNFEGRNDALLANSGDVQERGYIEAGDILLRVGSTLLVQNSGTEDRFAGITVTQNTLTVEPTSSGQIDVYAFGRRINADGTFVINTPYFREVAFGSGSGYIADAQFNTCFIASGRCGFGPEQPVPAGPEVIEGPIDEVEETSPPPNPDRQQFVDVSFASESLLEEPVTSGGDSGVWDEEGRDCEPGDQVCAQDGGGQ